MNFTLEKLSEARNAGIPDDVIWRTAIKADERFAQAKEKNIPLESAFRAFQKSQAEKPVEPEPERRAGGGVAGGAADIGVSFMKGLGTGTRMISDVFGANNPVSKAIAGYEDYMDGLLSAESKQDSQEISRILKDAEGKGILPQIMAGLEAFTVAPAEMTATTMGMMLPNLAGGVYAKAAQLTKAGALGLQMGIGAAQGIGSVKGQIYTAVQEELRQQGLPEDQIEPIATKAQAYNGKNLDQLLIAGGLGAIAASTGAEKIMTRLITGAGKEATEDIIKAAIKGGVAEAPIEGLQGGQEKLAENIALQRIGVDVPTMQGVIPAATMEATAGLLIGGGFGAVESVVSPEKRETDDIETKSEQTSRELTAENTPMAQAMVQELARRENAVKNLQDAYDALEPTSQEAQRLKLELGDAQRKLGAFKETAANAGLSVTITPVEQRQIELAKQIAAPVTPAPKAETREQIAERLKKQEEKKEAADIKKIKIDRMVQEDAVLDELLGIDPESNESFSLTRAEKEQRLTPQQRTEYGRRMLEFSAKRLEEVTAPAEPTPPPPSAPAPAEAPAITPATVEEAEFAELNDLMERRGQAQSKVKGVKFSKKDEARYNELLPKYRSRLFETITPEADPVVWKDIQGNDIKVSQKGTFYTVENGRVRTGPAFQSEGFIKDVSPQPVSAAVVESNNVPLPEGYTKQGDLYVYQPAVSETITPAEEAAPVTTPAPAEAVTPAPAAPTPVAPKAAPAPIVKQSKKRKGILGEQYINKDWTSLTKDELPQLNRELYNYYDWAKTVVDKLIPNANDFEKRALIMELRNEITEETAKPEFKDREQYILAQKVAGELITGKRRKILQRAKERAMGDEYAAWEMGGRFEESPISVEAFDSNAKGRPLPEGYTKQGDLYVYQPAVAPAKAAPTIRKMAPVRVEEKATPVPEADRYTFDEAGIRSIEFFGGKAPDGLLIVNDTTNPNYEMKAGYDPETGDIILNRAYIKKGESIEDILTHELGHYIYSDPKFQADFKNFLESMPDDTRAEIEAIINQSYNKDTNQTQIEERQVMAFTALVKANKDTLSKWETIKNTIKRWINKIFGTNIKLSDEGAMAVFNVGFKRFKSGERIIRAMGEGTLRTAPEGMTQMDRDYLAAVERGDMETAQRMVDEAAKKAMPKSLVTEPIISSKEKLADKPLLKVYHGTDAQFNVFERGRKGVTDFGFLGVIEGERHGIFFAENKDFAKTFAKSKGGDRVVPAFLNITMPFELQDAQSIIESRELGGEFSIDYNMARWFFSRSNKWEAFDDADGKAFVDWLESKGFDGAIIQEEGIGLPGDPIQDVWVALSPSQIKSADPVTYDDAGNVIPLSQRFRATSPDIRRMAAEPRKPAAEEKPITDPATPEEQTQQQVQSAQEQESIVDSAVKEAGATVFDVFNRLVNEGKTEEQVSQELGISKFEVRKLKLRADTAILNKMKQKKVQPLAFQPKNPVVDFAEKNAKKYFTKEGWLPKMVYQSWVKRNATLSREQKEAEYAIKDLYDGIRKVFGISKMEMITKGLVSVPPDFVQQLNDALAGQIDINTMPEPVREPLTRMRQHIDAMSRQLVALNVLPDDLSAKISDNLGVYLTRSYKIFTDKNWINKIPQEKLNNARNFLYKQQLKSDPTATIEMADRELRNMLNDWASEAEGLRKRGGKLGAKDLSVMMKRAEVPKALREVMGENMNVVFNYANTIGKISRFLADQRFLNEVKAKGTGQFLFTAADAPQGYNTQIAAEESRTMSPLNGLRTTPEIAKAFEEFGKGYDARENPALYALGWLNAVGKLNLTVGSILTQMRNMLGQPAFFVFNGHYNWAVIRQEIDAIAKDKGISREDAKRELIKQAAAQGLVNENAYAGELRTAFQEVGLETFDDAGPDEFVKEFVLTRMFKQGVRSAQDLYQKTDEFGKLVGWLNETKRIQRMNKGMDKATAQSIAAERTRDTYPTYSQSSEALRLFRRQPFIGPFATFFYETFRTSFHNLRYAFEDMKGPTPEHRAEGRKRLAGAMAQLSAGSFAINLISQALSNIGDDEEEDVRRMLPPWAKDASLLWLPKSKDGTYNFINLSYINPYNALTDPFIAMMSGFAKGEKPEEIATQAFGSFLSPFVDEQPVSAAIVDAMRNRTETGKQVYNPQDDIATKTSKIMLHIFGKTFTPGTLARLNQRIIPAIEGETVGTRAPAPVREVTAELTGIRFETLDMKAAFSNKAWEFSKAANESERIFRDVATRRRRVNEQEQIDAYRRSEQTRYEIWNDMYRDYMAVRRAGASQSEAIRLMTDIGISKKEAQAIARGRYTPYEISDEVKRRSKLNGNTVPLTQIKAIGREMPKVLTDIPAE